MITRINEAIRQELITRKEQELLEKECPEFVEAHRIKITKEYYNDLFRDESNRPSYLSWCLKSMWVRFANRIFLNALLCGVFGHKWVDSSFADANSGYVGYYCKRCGLSQGSDLY